MTDSEYRQKSQKMATLRGFTEHSEQAYDKMCSRFLSWCREREIEPADILIEQLQDYVVYLKKVVGYSPRTVNSNIGYLRFFFSYVLNRKIDRYMLPYSKVNKAPKTILTRDEIIQFINAAPNLKAKAMIALQYACGLRASELVALRYEDISRSHMTVLVKQAKNRSGRYIPLTTAALTILTAYWRESPKEKAWLFPGQNKEEHITTATLNAYIKQIAEKLGWQNRNITSHSFRHSIATHLYQDTKDILYVQEFLGHKSVTSTCIYVTRLDERSYPHPLDTLFGGINLE